MDGTVFKGAPVEDLHLNRGVLSRVEKARADTQVKAHQHGAVFADGLFVVQAHRTIERIGIVVGSKPDLNSSILFEPAVDGLEHGVTQRGGRAE
jgi:hypothetical protein